MYRWRKVGEGFSHLVDDDLGRTACGLVVFRLLTDPPSPIYCSGCEAWQETHYIFTEDDAKALLRLEADLR